MPIAAVHCQNYYLLRLTLYQLAISREASQAEVMQTAAIKHKVRCFRKRKSCCHIIAISQASIAAPTLTAMQGFQGKKECSVHLLSYFLVLHEYSVNSIKHDSIRARSQ